MILSYYLKDKIKFHGLQPIPINKFYQIEIFSKFKKIIP